MLQLNNYFHFENDKILSPVESACPTSVIVSSGVTPGTKILLAFEKTVVKNIQKYSEKYVLEQTVNQSVQMYFN